MPKETAPEVPTVAPRNDPKSLEPYARSRSLEVAGMDPDFAYQWCRKDELPRKLVAHEIGNRDVGYLMVDAWEVVHVKKGLDQGRGRDDAGKPLDTSMTNGELVFLRLHKSEFAKYAVIENKTDSLISKRLTKGESHDFGDKTTFKTRTTTGNAKTADLLQGIG